MAMFEKTTKAVKEAGESVIFSAKNIGNSIYSTSKEQSELAGMKVQKSVLDKRLKDSYARIGKRYVEYINNSDGEEIFDISDVLEEMQSDLDKLAQIEVTLNEKEAEAKKEEEEKREKKALEEFEAGKAKLDKALDMEIIDEEEYEEKMSIVQKKYDNHEKLRKIDMQLKMGIISEEEHADKVRKVLLNED